MVKIVVKPKKTFNFHHG